MAKGKIRTLLVVALFSASALLCAWIKIPQILVLSALPTTFFKQKHGDPRNDPSESCIFRHILADNSSWGTRRSGRGSDDVSTQQQQQQVHAQPQESVLSADTWNTLKNCWLHVHFMALLAPSVCQDPTEILTHLIVQQYAQYESQQAITRPELKFIESKRHAIKAFQAVEAHYYLEVPPDFDWLMYLEWHPAIKESGVTTEFAAKQHYLEFGKAEKWMYKRYCMVNLYYSSGGEGLVNQWYGHFAALMLAKALGSELVLPPAMHRASFAGETEWFKDPTEILLDVEAIAEYWNGRGMHIHAEEEPVLLTDNDKVSALQLQGNVSLDVSSRVYVDFGKYELSEFTFNETVALARKAIVVQTEARMRLNPEEDIPYIVVHFRSLFWPFRSTSDMVIAAEVARSLGFPPLLVELADEVLRHVTDHGKRPFNGLHLRLEGDIMHVISSLGGIEEVWKKYLRGMQEAGFSNDTHVYVASGLEENEILKDTYGLAVEVHHKAMYMSNSTFAGLNMEQRAAVDFLVLAQCSSFVGFGESTFSFLLPQYKTWMGYAPNLSVLVSGVNGMELFEKYGRVVNVSNSSVV